jgi:hypothetical protein
MDDPKWIDSYPVLDVNGFPEIIEVKMNQDGTLVEDGSAACVTEGAAGGCVPVCAAQFGGKGGKTKSGAGSKVKWIYLAHCHGTGLKDHPVYGMKLPIKDSRQVYVMAVHHAPEVALYEGNSWAYQDAICETLDPKNQIPPENTFVLRGKDAAFSTLAISPTGLVGVWPSWKKPVANPQNVPAQATTGCLKCFLSTAACETMGRPDNCRELRALRWFRDQILSQTDEGRRDISEYYANATRVVEQIDARFDRSVIYRHIYHRYVLPAVHAIDRGDYRAAHGVLRVVLRHYCRPVPSRRRSGRR